MIHVHFGFYFAVLGLVVGLSRGVGLPRGGFAIMAGLGLRPACLWGAVCGQAGAGVGVESQQPGQGPGLERRKQQCTEWVAG